MTAVIVDDLAAVTVPIDSVIPSPRNARRGDVEAIMASLGKFGQYKPIVVSADGFILAGNHTHAAAVRLGWERIAAIRVPVNHDHPEAQALAIADNRTSDLSRWHNDTLADVLAGLTGEPDLLAATGFTVDQVDELVAATSGGGGFTPPAGSGSDAGGSEGVVCPACHQPLP